MITTRSSSDKFVGRGHIRRGVQYAAKSRHAEVAWFLRRRTPVEARSLRNDNRPEYDTLRRRQFLVLPDRASWKALGLR